MDIITETMKEAATRFAEWMNDNRYSKYWGSDSPNCGKWYVQYTTPDRKYFTTGELWDLFVIDERVRLEKIKVSSHETIQQSADSGQLQQHVVMESVCQCDFNRMIVRHENADYCNSCNKPLRQTAP